MFYEFDVKRAHLNNYYEHKITKAHENFKIAERLFCQYNWKICQRCGCKCVCLQDIRSDFKPQAFSQ